MGIKGLFGHIMAKRMLPKQTFHDTQLVFDANNFFHNICLDIDNSYGGEFDLIAKETDTFLNELEKCNIQPVFVYIGAHDRDSKERVLQKNEERIQIAQRHFETGSRKAVFPVLGRLAFNNVLIEHGSSQVTSDHVDEVTAMTGLANKLGCPIFSSNTEFFIPQLVKGVVAVQNCHKFVKFDRGKMVAPYFRMEDLMTKNRLGSPFRVALFAAATKYYDKYKNEHGSGVPEPAGFRAKRLEEMMTLVRQTDAATYEETIRIVAQRLDDDEPEECEEFLKKTTDEYVKTDDSVLYEYLEDEEAVTTARRYDGEELPLWFRRAWTRGDMPRYLCGMITNKEVNLPCQMEDVNQASSFDCSRDIRTVTYGILTSGEDPGLAEYGRMNDSPVYQPVEPKYELDRYGTLPLLSQIPNLSIDNRKQLIMNALDSDVVNMDDLDPDWVLFIAVCKYWAKTAEPTREHVQALLLCAIKLRIHDRLTTPSEDKTLLWFRSRDGSCDVFTEPGRLVACHDRAQLQHAFAQWQACVLDSNQLNELLSQPYRSVRPEFCYKGTLAFRYLNELREGKRVNEYIGETGRYREFFDLCMREIA